VALLEDRPRVMLERFYGLGRPRESSAEIGDTEGVTRQRIDQILKQARAELAELLEES
jgi:DNA-directed RNA polymerase sigma subunit (sigma70/sigma32)